MTIAPAAALLVLLTAVVLAVVKPWGPTRFGRRNRAANDVSVGRPTAGP